MFFKYSKLSLICIIFLFSACYSKYYVLNHAVPGTNNYTITVLNNEINNNFNINDLSLSNEQLLKNSIQNERVLDMVRVFSIDSLLGNQSLFEKNLPFNIVRWATLGKRNKYYQPLGEAKKEKMVGQMCNDWYKYNMKITKEDDLNLDLQPHLPKYVQMTVDAVNNTKLKGKFVNELHTNAISMCPEALICAEKNECYHMEGELTISKKYYTDLEKYFFPINKSSVYDLLRNFGTQTPVLGFYGAWVGDGIHGERPEIHPIEWIWWRSLVPDFFEKQAEQAWRIGFFSDRSKRFKKWSSSPRVGQIAIPFYVLLDDWKNKPFNLEFDINHLVSDSFYPNMLQKINGLPSNTFNPNFNSYKATVMSEAQKMLGTISITDNNMLKTMGLAAWVDKLNYTPNYKYLCGYFNIALAVKSIYAARVSYTFY